jgi:toxin HigB-1
MAPTYRDRRTQRFAEGEFVKEFQAMDRAAERKLRMLQVAKSLNDLRQIPGNRLEKLSGDRRGQFSVRINDQYRICFEWPDNEVGAQNIEITDYH